MNGGNRRKKDQYADWASYFNAKKAKQDDQFNKSSTEDQTTKPQIFQGVTIYINGYTNPPEPELRSLFTSHGGQYSQYFGTHITFVIATNLPLAKKKLMWHKTLKPEWITESISAGDRLDHRNYALYSLAELSKQKTLTQVVGLGIELGNESKDSANSASAEVELLNDIRLQDKEYKECPSAPNQDHPSPSHWNPNDSYVSKELEHESKEPKLLKTDTGISTTADANFLQDFYNNSRLHLISTMKKDTQQMVADWRRNISGHKFELLQKFKTQFNEELLEGGSSSNQNTTKQVIMHIDLDCFFVAVARMSRPHLIGKPVVVTHSKGTGAKDSKSDVSCASYEARAKGVKAGMWLDEVKRLCPDVHTVPYDFEAYKSVSKLFFETIASLSLDIEPISCDELYLNATKVIDECKGSNPVELANFLRNEVERNSKVVASIGIGYNKLSARIATSLAKENQSGTRLISEEEITNYISKLSVRKLPGIGYATAEKLYECFKVENCDQLQKLTLEELKQTLGIKTGIKLYGLCRGVDNDTVNCEALHQAKSVSAGCSFGVRFNSAADMSKFIKDIAIEVSKRANQSKCYGGKLTLSLWIVRKGFEHDPIKPGGHGAADVHSRTRSFMSHTRDINVIFKTASELARTITLTTVPVNHIRGVRISLDQLRYEADMSDKEKKTIQNTLHSSLFQKPTFKQTLEADIPDHEQLKNRQHLEPETSKDISKSSPDNNLSLITDSKCNRDSLIANSSCQIHTRLEFNSEPNEHEGSKIAGYSATSTNLSEKPVQVQDNLQKPLKSCLKPFVLSFSTTNENKPDDEPKVNELPEFIKSGQGGSILQSGSSINETATFERGPRQLLPLNGITNVSEIKYLFRTGVLNFKPQPSDIETIEKYLLELIHRKFLKEAQSLMGFLWSLLPGLKESGEEDHMAWYDGIYTFIVDIEEKLRYKFGGVFVLPSFPETIELQ